MNSVLVVKNWKTEKIINFVLRYKRRYAESLVYNGDMIIMGGYNNQQGWLNSVEKVSSSGEISELPDWKLPRKIFDHCAVQMDNGKIMVIGGNNLSI